MELELSPGRWIGAKHPVYIIAEIGQNHQGSLDMAKELITRAKKAGADCVKFQKSQLDAKFTQRALDAPYTGPNSWGATYGEHKTYLDASEMREIQSHATQEGIAMTASGMDIPSADFLVKELRVPFLKIGSGDSNNPLLLQHVAAMTDVKLVVSTGMSDMDQVEAIYGIMRSARGTRKNCVFLQCTSAYPTPPEDAHLTVMDTYRKSFPDVLIGYSGHELGFIATLGAVAKGAVLIERHITLDKAFKGSDHKCSLDIGEFAGMVQAVRQMEACLGSSSKQFLAAEKPCYDKLGKTLVASQDLAPGTPLGREHLAVKVSQEKGLSPLQLSRVLGKRLIRALDKDEAISEECF